MPNRATALLTALSLTWLASPGSAQETLHQVVPGRDFEQHKLLTPGLTDVWELVVERDEMLWCKVDSNEFDPVLELVDAEGNLLGSNDGAGTHSELWVRAPAAGKYVFRVKPFQGSGGGNYRYWLHRFATESIAANAEASHTFGKAQWWHYRIALQQGDVLVPTVLGDGRLTAVFDAGRNPLRELHGGYHATQDGDCFVRIEGSEGRRCQVLTQLGRAGERAVGERYDERLAPYGLDTWRFCLPAGQALVLDVSMPDAVLGVDVREQSPTDQGPAFVATGHFDKGGQRRLLYFVRREAVMVLHLRHRGSTTARYGLALCAWGEPVTVGTAKQATLPLGHGALFHLPLAAGELVDVAVDSEAFDACFDLWDPDGNVAATVDDRGPLDRNASHRFLVTRPGIWHVLVHRVGVASGPFTLRSERQSLPHLVVGGSLQVAWPTADHVHVDLQAGQVVWLALTSANFDAALQVIDPNGDSGFVAEGGGIGGDVLVAYRASHTGRHTLVVHARSGQGTGLLRAIAP